MSSKVLNVYGIIKGIYYLRHSKKLGKRPQVKGNPYIDKHLGLYIGDRINLWSFFDKICFFGGGKLEIGDDCFINNGTIIECRDNICMGNNVNIGYRVLISDTSNHSIDGIEPVKVKPIKIGNNVWIASNCTILAGITIGDNSIVGAGSVVTKDILTNTLVVGNPPKVIRTFDFKGKRR